MSRPRHHAAPPVHDLGSTTGLSICSSPSTITCSVWSSGRSMVSSFDVLSTMLPISTITFSSAISDDEEEDEITLDQQQPPNSSSSFEDGGSTSTFVRQQRRHSTSSIDPFAISERSLFQDPTQRMIDYAPMAPSRQQHQQRLLGNQKWTTTNPSPNSCKYPGGKDMGTNHSKPGLRLDVQPRMPTRSFHGDDDDDLASKKPIKVGPLNNNRNNNNNIKDLRLLGSQSLHDVPPFPATRRERLVQRLAAVQRIVDPSTTTTTAPPTTGACRRAPIFDMNDKSDPPKLPIRTTHDDMSESVVSDDDDDSGDDFACDEVEDIILLPTKQSVVDDDDDLQITMEKPHEQQHEESVGSSTSGSQEENKQPNKTKTTASKQRSKKPKPSKATTPKSTTTANKKKAAANKEGADPQESITSTKTPSAVDHTTGTRRRSTGSSDTTTERRAAKRLLRPRSKDPPQRFATAPASLSSSGDAKGKTYISKRRVRSNKSSSSERRSRRQFVSNSLASILEDENENTTSPVREEPKAPISCPAAIETSGLEERYDSILDLENRFSSKTRGGRSWAGTASRNLL